MVVRDDDIKILKKFLDFCYANEEFHVFFERLLEFHVENLQRLKMIIINVLASEDITFNFVYNSLYNKEKFMYECKL